MATFLCLPNEIILQVVETTEPDDIENLVLCCKRVHDLAGSVLRQHRKHQAICSRFNQYLAPYYSESEQIAFYSSLRDPSMSKFFQPYPKEVEVENFLSGAIPRSKEVTEDVRRICDSIFQELDSPYMDETWHSNIYKFGVGSATCLLLTLLPNVRNMTVWDWGGLQYDNQLGDMIEKISKTNDGASQQIQGKLSLLRLQEADIRWRLRPVWQTSALEAFMSLPSLKVIRGRNLAPDHICRMRTYPDHFSNVTQFHFRRCALPEWYFAALVRRPKALQVFSYDHFQRAETETRGLNYRPDKHIQSLYTCAEETLAFLNYTSDAADEIGDHREPDSSMLHNFKALKILRISRVLLIAGGIFRRLVDELPSSLEELELVEPLSAAEAQRMLDGMLAMKRGRCPNLRLIVFEVVIPLDQVQIEAYERTGLVLDRRNIIANTIMKTGQKWLGGIECERR